MSDHLQIVIFRRSIRSQGARTALTVAVLLAFSLLGCGAKKADDAGLNLSDSNESTSTADATLHPADQVDDPLDMAVGEGPIELVAYEVHAKKLLSSVLPTDKLEQGWVRLFDGHTLAGWNIVGQADWQCRDGVLRVSRGERSYLSTAFEIADFELSIDFRAGPQTNSGIFLRTSPEPNDAGLDCLELNIAPPDNPFPTASMVLRERVEPEELGDFDPTQWHNYLVRLDGENVTVILDGVKVLEMIDDTSSHRGHISLQHNEGIVEFRNIMMRPLQHRELQVNSNWQEDWTTQEKQAGTLAVEQSESGLFIRGGLGKVETHDHFGDFLLQANYSLPRPDVNSGIFFRCVEGSMLDGYECQINHSVVDGDPLRPADAGTGAIFRRRDARIVVGDGTQPTYLTLLASGNQMVTWVNGLLTAEFYDNRPPDENPRKGSRLAAGPIALQGHDPSTEITFHRLQITELR